MHEIKKILDKEIPPNTNLKDFEFSLIKKQGSEGHMIFNSVVLQRNTNYRLYLLTSKESEGTLYLKFSEEGGSEALHYDEIKDHGNVKEYDILPSETKAWNMMLYTKSEGYIEGCIYLTYLKTDDNQEEKIIKITAEGKATWTHEKPKEDNEAYRIVEEMPRFQGSKDHSKLIKYIQENIRYKPEFGKETFNIYVQFIVNKDGYVQDVKIIRGIDNSALKQEVMRVFYAMPQWEPGKQDGKNVNVIYTVPIEYKIK